MRSVWVVVAMVMVTVIISYVATPTLALLPSTTTVEPLLDDTASLHRHMVYAPDTDPVYITQMEALLHPEGENYNIVNRWNWGATAYQTGGNAQGESLILTWSIVPDGTVIPGGSLGGGEPACNSNMFAVMNNRYGEGLWQAEIQEVFEEWGTLTGNTYIFEPTDDGAAWPTSPGRIGLRGDIRISGCAIDGDYNTLAYNFFPTYGDTKFDSTDAYFDSPQGALATGFHYVMAHEHGHGLGLGHVCPFEGNKLMEPSVNTGFNSAQHDDMRGGQRTYGDGLERPLAPNDNATAATEAGVLKAGEPITYTSISLDDESDEDWIKFTVGEAWELDVTVAPVGTSYQDGDIDGNNCVGPVVHSHLIHNLDFQILDSDGVTVLVTGSSSPAGINEVLNNISQGAAGVKYIRIYTHSTTEDVQIYNLTFTGEPLPITPTPTPTITMTPTVTPSATATATALPSTATPTATLVPPTVTPTFTPSPTATATVSPTTSYLYLPIIGKEME